jgi:tripartite-type tricarboxylate transporter receptor subunit TctC
MKPVSRVNVVLVAFMIAVLLPGADPIANAASRTYPDKSRSLSYICPYPAGGSAEVSGRIVSTLLGKELGIPAELIVKAGAGGQVGVTELTRSRRDGYTVGLIVFPTVITTYNDPDRKAIFSRKSFELLGSHMKDPGVIVVRADGPFKTLKDMIDAAKAKPGSIRTTTSGILSDDHIAAVMTKQVAGVKFAIVHFDGATPGRTAVLGGHVEAYYGNASEVLGQVRGGEMRILAVLDEKRSPFYPDVKTAEEQGYPIFSGVQHGVAMPAGVPNEARDVLVAAYKRAITSDEFKDRMEKVALQSLYLDPQEYSAFWARYEAGIVKWIDVCKKEK